MIAGGEREVFPALSIEKSYAKRILRMIQAALYPSGLVIDYRSILANPLYLFSLPSWDHTCCWLSFLDPENILLTNFQ
jgi:hypothetical protein